MSDELEPNGLSATAIGIQRSLRILIITTVVLFLCIGAVTYYVYSVAKDVNDGVCAFRADVQTRSVQTKKYLKKHPHGTRLISSSDLQIAIKNTERTVDALSSVNCPPTLSSP